MTTPFEMAKDKPLWDKAESITELARQAISDGAPDRILSTLARLAECAHMLSIDDRPYAIDVMDMLVLEAQKVTDV